MLCFIGILMVHGSYVQEPSHHVPSARTVVHSQTIHGGAIGGNPSTGAFSSAHFSQTFAVPSRGRPMSSIPYSRNIAGVQGSFQSQNFPGIQNFQGSNQGYQNSGQRSATNVSNISFNPLYESFQRQNYNNQELTYTNGQASGYNSFLQSYRGEDTSQFNSNPIYTSAQNFGNENFISQRNGVNGQGSFANTGSQYRSVSMVRSRYY